jgi:hypothetical protein
MDVTSEMYNLLRWLKANISTDEMRESLQCIHVKNNGTTFESSDGYKLVIAKLDQPLHADLTDGLWLPVTIAKKVVTMVKVDDVTFPDTSIILTDYDKPITDTQTFTTLNPEFLYSVISGFDTFDLNLVTNNRPVQIVLHSISMPIGTYVAIVMPYYSDANFTTIQSDIRAVKDK